MNKTLFILALLFLLISADDGQAIECIFCHQYGSEKFPIVDTSLFGVHADVNSTDGAGNVTSQDCITCHYSANTSSLHQTPVSTYTCEDCHINGTLPSAPVVNNHDGTSNVSLSASCAQCHNKTSNIFSYSENASAAHYGRNASFGISQGEMYCAYCHQNASTMYRDVMRNQINIMVGNHTSGRLYSLHPAGRPNCSHCHGMDKIHGTNLTKPYPDSVFCNDCHMLDTLRKNMHAGKVECILCHTDTASDIHNIKYLLIDGTYQSVNATRCANCHDFSLQPPFFRLLFDTANCTTCHIGNGRTKFENAPRFQSMNHSRNPASGGLWNGSQPAYWDGQANSCKYCHGNTLHNANAIGNVSNIKSGNALNQSITNNSFWCSNCHYNGSDPTGNYSYSATSYYPVPPEIQNNSGLVPDKANDGTSFYNHSLEEYSDKTCFVCHTASSPLTTAKFVHDVVAGGGGRDCISCHDTGGSGSPADKRINVSSFNMSVHSSIDSGGNRACLACHGNARQDSEPESGHPENYRNPKNCNNNDCHSLAQSVYKENMIYSHFQNASMNNNPEKNTNYNITVSMKCEVCHKNSLVTDEGNSDISKVSHYRSKDPLIDSFDCIYCHLDKDNSEHWGNANLIYRNTTSLILIDKEEKEFKVFEGSSFYLGEGYFLKLKEISDKRNSALIQLIYNNSVVDDVLLTVGFPYQYEKEIIIDNSTFKTPVIILNLTNVFKGEEIGFIQFNGSRIRKTHTERENTDNSACFACHLYRFSSGKERYQVIDREHDENPSRDIIYFIRVFLDFKEGNKSKIYFDDENYVFEKMNQGKIISYSSPQKYLKEGETWNIADGYSLRLDAVSSSTEEAVLTLKINDITEQQIIKSGSEFNYTPGIRYRESHDTNVTVFAANVSAIGDDDGNYTILKNVIARSHEVMKTTANTTIFGYNASWLNPYDLFMTGRIPENLHSVNLLTDPRKWADCVMCHDSSKLTGISTIDAISSRLGKHSGLNNHTLSITVLSDPINRACWACHTYGQETTAHSPPYISPVNCKSCHTYQQTPNYGATNISDEQHGYEPECEPCHIIGSHKLKRYELSPVIRKAYLSGANITKNETVQLEAQAAAGYKMKIRAVEYFIDEKGMPGKGIPMQSVSEKDNSQIIDVSARINPGNLSIGDHTIYVHAMERNNRWGEFYPVGMKIVSEKSRESSTKSSGYGANVLIVGGAAAYLIYLRRRPPNSEI